MPHDAHIQVIGPTDASVAKINDVYRKVIYIKSKSYELLAVLKDGIERDRAERKAQESHVEFDFNP